VAGQGLSPLWKQPLALATLPSRLLTDERNTIDQRRSKEVVAAYDVSNGHEVWTQAWNAEYHDSTGDGPRTTPTWDDGRLYALGANRRASLSRVPRPDGLWARIFLATIKLQNLQWAMAASPLNVDDK